jgi:hypothetical protein
MKYILLGILLIPVLCFSQRLTVNEVDKFNKLHRLQTSNVRLKTGMLAYIRSAIDSDKNAFYYIKLFGSVPTPDVIGSGDRLIFLLENDSTVTVYSTGVQSYEISPKMYYHQYRATEEDIETLAKNNIKSIRKYGTDGYIDVEIPGKNQGDLKDAAILILKAVKKITE